MNIHHHPDDSTLVSYAAGSLAPAMALIVDCHSGWCPRCRERIADAEQLGGTLLESANPQSLASASRDGLLARLDQEEFLDEEETAASPAADSPEHVPVKLRDVLGESYDAIQWHSMAPGIRQVQLESHGRGARLLRIAPGTSMPIHSHGGSELTLVLKGSYTDEIGRFRPGDVADLDPTVEHQPIADSDEPCICLIATDAPLRFRGIVPRLLQPFFGL